LKRRWKKYQTFIEHTSQTKYFSWFILRRFNKSTIHIINSVSNLSCHRTRQRLRIESPPPPGHNMTAAVFRHTIKGTRMRHIIKKWLSSDKLECICAEGVVALCRYYPVIYL
jgi:hypothetical protein